MGTLASGSIDLKSLKIAGEPNKYITYIDANNGIRVYDAKSNGNYVNFVQLNSYGMQIYKGGTANTNKVADFSSTITLGNSEDVNNQFNIKIINTTDTEDEWGDRGPGILLRQGKTVLTEMTGTGLNIYGYYALVGEQASTWTKLASFGEQTKIGVDSYTLINNGGIGFYNSITNNPFGNISFSSKTKENYQQSYTHEWSNYSETEDSYRTSHIIADNVFTISGHLEFIVDGDPSSTLYTDDFTYNLSKDDRLASLTYEDTIQIGNDMIYYNLSVRVGAFVISGIDPLQCAIGHFATLSEDSSLLSYFKINLNITYNAYIGGPHYSFGNTCNSIGQYAFAMGNNTIARENCQLTIGKFNIPIDDALFVIGNGTDNNNRSNLMEVADNLIKIGKEDAAHINITSGGLDLYNGATQASNLISHLGYDSSVNSGNTPYFTFGRRASGLSNGSKATSIVPGLYSVVEGLNNIAQGEYSHAEGVYTEAVGNYSHAEGTVSYAVGAYSHVEGSGNYAIGDGSHAGGSESWAGTYDSNDRKIGNFSFVHGDHVNAVANFQTVFGKNNIEDSDALFIIGNGDNPSQRSNLMVVGDNFIRMGNNNSSHTVIDSNGQRFYAGNGITLLANIGYGTGQAESGTAVAPYYTFGRRDSDEPTVGNWSVAAGVDVIASGVASHAEGINTAATSQSSHAEGFACGAWGLNAHAEGASSYAIGESSHAQNIGTRANKKAQTTIGSYNINDESITTTHSSGTVAYGKYAFIIGNGVLTSRSNALTVDWTGNIRMYLGSDTTDLNLMSTITALGWDSEVIELD